MKACSLPGNFMNNLTHIEHHSARERIKKTYTNTQAQHHHSPTHTYNSLYVFTNSLNGLENTKYTYKIAS